MWRINKIEVLNIGPFDQFNFEIPIGRTTMIVGKNNDQVDQFSNGSGKSFLLECFSLGLLGDSLKKVRDIYMIRDDQEEGFIKIFMENKFLKKKMIIERIFHRKKGSSLKIKINEEDQADKFPTIPEGNKFIFKQIGLSREDFLSYYLISKKRYVSFYSSSDTAKKELINRFSGADLIIGVEEGVEKKIKELEDEKKIFNDEIIKIDAQSELLEEDLEKEKQRDLEKEKQDRVKEIEKKIKEEEEERLLIGNNKSQTKTKIQLLKKTVEAEQKLLDLVDDVDNSKKIKEYEKLVNDAKKIIREKEESVEVKRKDKKPWGEFLNDLEKILAEKIECPRCHYEFLLSDEKISIEEAKKQKPDVELEIQKIEKSVAKVELEIEEKELQKKKKNSEIQLLEKEQEELEEKRIIHKEKIRKTNEEVAIQENIITRNENKIKAHDLQILDYKESIKKIKKSKEVTKEKEILEKLDMSKELREGIEEEIKKIDEKIYEEGQWTYNFKKFNSFLANKAIKSIEGFTNMNLEGSKSDLRIRLEGFKILANKQIREKITALALREGSEEPIEKLSEGELA
ncbi:MAG TPA: hypothetical protein ENH06_01130, partial [bacterium]|nr:hypothetical protein [bacterium]